MMPFLDGHIEFTFQKATDTFRSLNVRYPSWATQAAVKINGKKQSKINSRSGYIVLSEKWKAEDKVEINFEMELQLIAAKDNPNQVAIAYVPIVLAGEMGTEGFTKRGPYSDLTQHHDYYTYDFNLPVGIQKSFRLDRSNLSATIKQVPGKALTFQISEGVI